MWLARVYVRFLFKNAQTGDALFTASPRRGSERKSGRGGEQLTDDNNTPPRLTPIGHMTLFGTLKGMLPVAETEREKFKTLTGVALSDRFRREEEAVCIRERVVGETVQLAVHLSLRSRSVRYQASVSPVGRVTETCSSSSRFFGDIFFFCFIFHAANLRLTAHARRNDKPAPGEGEVVLVSAGNADRGSGRRRAYEPGQLLERLPGISAQPMLLLSTDHVLRRGRGPIDSGYFLCWN